MPEAPAASPLRNPSGVCISLVSTRARAGPQRGGAGIIDRMEKSWERLGKQDAS